MNVISIRVYLSAPNLSMGEGVFQNEDEWTLQVDPEAGVRSELAEIASFTKLGLSLGSAIKVLFPANQCQVC